jgi:hypothetical protein
MVNYIVTGFATARKASAELALADLTTQLSTISDAKTLRFLKVVKKGMLWVGLAIYDS